MSNDKFFTNQGENTLFNKFSGTFEHNRDLRHFDVLVGYFRASGYFKIRPLLESIQPIRILVGIDIDALTLKAKNLGTLFKAATPEEIRTQWEKQFLQDIAQAKYSKDIEDGILQFSSDISTGKVQIKAHPAKNIHAKVYILRPESFNEHNSGYVITGSSNLTDAGLGTKSNPNYEFNVLLKDYPDVKFASEEFEKLWQEGKDISAEFVNAAQQRTYLQEITPYELYLKTLIEYFGDEIEFDPSSITDLPSDIKRLDYQMDAVNQAYQILEKHNGCFLSDVVGLGKTIIATLVIRMFYYKNGYPNYRSRILLVIPPALKDNWKAVLREFRMQDAVNIITNGKLATIENRHDYDMVVIDEAHKFRNNASQSYQEMQLICKAPTSRGEEKKVMLISATPLNNRAGDLYNQLLLFQDGNRSSLGFSVSNFFNQIDKEQREIRKLKNRQEVIQRTKAVYEHIREKIIEPLMVRRTRTDLLENERYKKDLQSQSIVFPKVHAPDAIYYKLPPVLEKLFDRTLEIIDNKELKRNGLCYTRYRALQYLVPEKRQHYARVEFISNQLVAIMKTLLLKRMDSSFTAFRSTLSNFLSSSQAMLKMIENDRIYIASNIKKIEEYINDDNEEELIALLEAQSQIDPSIIICTCDDFEPGFITGVKSDHKILKKLVADWEKIQGDPKLDTFNQKLPELLNKDKNPEQRLIIFTESRDTMRHLQKNIAHDNVLGVASFNISGYKDTIKENFDASLELDKQRSDINLLITTDILAEGINLHRANIVINYDTPWNTTRLMQRIGRVNRIGSKAANIYAYNFRPTAQVDDQIELEKKAILKLQAFHSALGEDSQIYSDDEEVQSFGIFDGDIQAEKSESLPYLEEIRQYKANNPQGYQRLKEMPAKMRNAVKNQQRCGSTLTFMRTDDKHTATFSLVNDKQMIETYPFTKAIKLLEAKSGIKAWPLPANHHQQVNMAVTEFERCLEEAAVRQHQTPQLNPTDQTATRFVEALLSIPTITESQQNMLQQTIETLRNKVYRNLAPDLAKLSKTSKNIKPLPKLNAALNIISCYNIATAKPTAVIINKDSLHPAIIISQSYV